MAKNAMAQAILDPSLAKSEDEIQEDLRKLLVEFLVANKKDLMTFDHNESAVPARIAELEAVIEGGEVLSVPETALLHRLKNYWVGRKAGFDEKWAKPFADIKGCTVEEARHDILEFIEESWLLDRVGALKSWNEVHDILATTDVDGKVVSAVRGVKRLTIEEYEEARALRATILAEVNKRKEAEKAIAEGRSDWEPYNTELASQKYPKTFVTRDVDGNPFYWAAKKRFGYKLFRDIEERFRVVRASYKKLDTIKERFGVARKKHPAPLGHIILEGRLGVIAVSRYVTFEGEGGNTTCFMVFDSPRRNTLRVLEVTAEGPEADELLELVGKTFPFTPHPRRPHLRDRAMNVDVREVIEFTLRLNERQ